MAKKKSNKKQSSELPAAAESVKAERLDPVDIAFDAGARKPRQHRRREKSSIVNASGRFARSGIRFSGQRFDGIISQVSC